LPAISRLKRLYLHWLSGPRNDRFVYRAARWPQVRKIVELGVGTGRRAVRMIEAASQFTPPGEIHYTGIDLFEDRNRGDTPGLGLKDAYQRLKATGVRVQLTPGDPCTGLARIANLLSKIDLVVISAAVDQAALARAWFYVPRILHDESQLFLEEIRFGGKTAFRMISCDEVAWLAAKSRPLRRAA
jgi:predicted O-methyltransferase YrrM